MVAYTLAPRMKNPVAAVAPLAVALFAAGVVGLAPVAMIEDAVMASGLPAVLPAAAPPLGLAARLALALIAAAVAGGALHLLFGLSFVARLVDSGRDDDVALIEMAPQIRRADAHPDAPPRAPLRAASDLGEVRVDVPAPPAAEPAERALPDDLDQPMAQFDPAALPERPLAPPQPLRSLRPATVAKPLECGERLETFELTRVGRAPEVAAASEDDTPIAGPETEATVHALLARLERGVERRARRRREAADAVVAASGLDHALDRLRKLAVNG